MAHPTWADPSYACVRGTAPPTGPPLPLLPLQGTLSYWDGTGACFAPNWGGHASPCPALPSTGTQDGEYCGPLVPAGGSIRCFWQPLLTTLPTNRLVLAVGFDQDGDGLTRLNEGVQLLDAPGSATFTNSWPAAGRVIAYPTGKATTLTFPGDQHLVVCI